MPNDFEQQVSDANANPKLRALALNGLASSLGWGIYCERFQEIIRMEIEAEVWKPETTDERRRTLVAARKVLCDTYLPEKIRKTLLVSAETEIARQDREREARRG